MTNPPADDTRASRAGWTAAISTRPSNSPIYQTTAFDIESLEQLDSVAAGREKGYIYTRDGNPNHDAFAADVAALEGAEAGLVTASGMGALAAIVLGLVRSGDHVLAARVLYGRTPQLLNHLQSAFGVEVSYFDANKPDEVRSGVRPNTKLCLVESISNPLIEVADLAAIVAGAGSVPVLVDSTFATPVLLKPISHGATLVYHSASKYLNGHGDVMLGVVVGPLELIRKARQMMTLFGLNGNPLECWLGARGLRTLCLRMERVSQSAQIIAERLEKHPQVRRVYYPTLASHASRALAEQYLKKGSGGMLAFEINGGRDAVNRLFQALHETIPFSPTLADARTTVSYPAGTSHKFMSPREREACGISDGLVRLSIGLEHPDDLFRELEAGIGAIRSA